MKQKRFVKEQITTVLREHGTDTTTGDMTRKHGSRRDVAV